MYPRRWSPKRGESLPAADAASRTSAYVYGNILVLAALVPLSIADVRSGTAVLIVLGTAVSTFFAHLFAETVGGSMRVEQLSGWRALSASCARRGAGAHLGAGSDGAAGPGVARRRPAYLDGRDRGGSAHRQDRVDRRGGGTVARRTALAASAAHRGCAVRPRRLRGGTQGVAHPLAFTCRPVSVMLAA